MTCVASSIEPAFVAPFLDNAYSSCSCRCGGMDDATEYRMFSKRPIQEPSNSENKNTRNGRTLVNESQHAEYTRLVTCTRDGLVTFLMNISTITKMGISI